MEGLEYRVKQNEARIAEKIDERMRQSGLSLEEAKAAISDSLRYTAVFSNDDYTNGIVRLVADMKAKGITPVGGKDKNYWPPPPGIYHGANYVFKDPSGFKFELQFHTKESLATKSAIHGLYEEFRNPATSKGRRVELWKQMNAKWAAVPVPPGVKSVGTSQQQEQA